MTIPDDDMDRDHDSMSDDSPKKRRKLNGKRRTKNNPDEILNEIKSCQEALDKFREMGVDSTEFNLLRAIILFQSGSVCEVKKQLKDLVDQAQLTLNNYVNVAYPSQPLRFGRLLLLLPLLKSISATTIQNLFFKNTIGDKPLGKLICDMYKDKL